MTRFLLLVIVLLATASFAQATEAPFFERVAAGYENASRAYDLSGEPKEFARTGRCAYRTQKNKAQAGALLVREIAPMEGPIGGPAVTKVSLGIYFESAADKVDSVAYAKLVEDFTEGKLPFQDPTHNDAERRLEVAQEKHSIWIRSDEKYVYAMTVDRKGRPQSVCYFFRLVTPAPRE